MSDNYMDYRVYKYTPKELAVNIIISGMFLFICGYLFFKNIYISAGLASASLIYVKIKKRDLKIKRDMLISRQFCDALQFISSSLSTGKTIERAFRDAVNELEILYGSDNEIIIRELKQIVKKISVNESIIEALSDFAERTGNEDIRSFKDALKLIRITGGNLTEVAGNTHSVMSLKLEVINEISMIVAEQRLNFRILMIIPFALLAFMNVTCPDYMAPLYTGQGAVISVAVLFLLLIAWMAGNKIIKFDI